MEEKQTLSAIDDLIRIEQERGMSANPATMTMLLELKSQSEKEKPSLSRSDIRRLRGRFVESESEVESEVESEEEKKFEFTTGQRRFIRLDVESESESEFEPEPEMASDFDLIDNINRILQATTTELKKERAQRMESEEMEFKSESDIDPNFELQELNELQELKQANNAIDNLINQNINELAPFRFIEETKEDRIDLAMRRFEEQLEQHIEENNKPLILEGFSPDDISNIFIRSDDIGIFENMLEEKLIKALRVAIPLNKADNAIATIKQGIGQLNVNEPEDINRILDNIILRVTSRKEFEGLEFNKLPINIINAGVERFFGDLINTQLTKPNLNEFEIKQLTDTFREELESYESFGENSKQNMDNILAWINLNVENPALKKILTNNVIFRFNEIQEQQQGITGVNPQLRPLSEGRAIFLTKNIQNTLSRSISNELNDVFDITFDRIDEEKQIIPIRIGRIANGRQKAVQKEQRRILTEIAINANNIIKNNNIRILTPEGQISPLIDIRPKNEVKLNETTKLKNLMKRLKNLTNSLASETNNFTYLPLLDEEFDQNESEFMKDIISKMKTPDKKRKSDRSSLRAHTTSHNFGNITVLTTTENNMNEYEIIIPGNASMEDLLKLITGLLQEDGIIYDVDGTQLLIITEKTTMAQILKTLRLEQKNMLGKQIKINYLPKSNVGGSYIGGALSSILKQPLRINNFIPASGIPKLSAGMKLLNIPFHKLYNPIGGNLTTAFDIQITPESRLALENRGGNIFGDIFNTVGNIAKTVASVPLALTGAVFGGNLNNVNSFRSIPA